MAIDVIDRRMQSLRKERGQRNAEAADWGWYNFRVTPTCPPSKQLYMRGGLLWNPYPGDYYAWQVPAGLCDLADANQVFGNYYSRREDYGYEVTPGLTWTNAYWYKPFTLVLRLHDWDPENLTFVLCELEDYALEYETTPEAEAAWPDTFSTWQEAWYTDGHPLCGLILRNDGTPGSGHFQAIDPVNRGRSYIWPRDARPLDYLV